MCNFFLKKNLLGVATSITAPRLRLQMNISAALVLHVGCCIQQLDAHRTTWPLGHRERNPLPSNAAPQGHALMAVVQGLPEQAYCPLKKVMSSYGENPCKKKKVVKPYCSGKMVGTSATAATVWIPTQHEAEFPHLFLTYSALISVLSQLSWAVHCPVKAPPFTPWQG